MSLLAKEPYKRDYILQKRPIIFGSLLIIAKPQAFEKHLSFHLSARPNVWSLLAKEPCTHYLMFLQKISPQAVAFSRTYSPSALEQALDLQLTDTGLFEIRADKGKRAHIHRVSKHQVSFTQHTYICSWEIKCLFTGK